MHLDGRAGLRELRNPGAVRVHLSSLAASVLCPDEMSRDVCVLVNQQPSVFHCAFGRLRVWEGYEMLVIPGWSFDRNPCFDLACLRLYIEIQVYLTVFLLPLSHQMPSSNENF